MGGEWRPRDLCQREEDKKWRPTDLCLLGYSALAKSAIGRMLLDAKLSEDMGGGGYTSQIVNLFTVDCRHEL